jgi:hypothetical protein
LFVDEGLDAYSETWPKAGSMRGGRLYQRATLEPLTVASGSSSSPHKHPYPTPSATEYGSSGNGTGNNVDSRGRPSLSQMVARRTRKWPTACTTDAKDSARGTTTTGIMHPGTSLTDAMRASAATWEPDTSGPPTTKTTKDGADTLVLVPEFVEALMGLPEGWTLVDGESVWLAWVTLLCRSKRLGPLRACSSDPPNTPKRNENTDD